jgi:hypothetical protein
MISKSFLRSSCTQCKTLPRCITTASADRAPSHNSTSSESLQTLFGGPSGPSRDPPPPPPGVATEPTPSKQSLPRSSSSSSRSRDGDNDHDGHLISTPSTPASCPPNAAAQSPSHKTDEPHPDRKYGMESASAVPESAPDHPRPPHTHSGNDQGYGSGRPQK